jgi:hypothetical protein
VSDRDETSSRLRVGAWLPPTEVPGPGGPVQAAPPGGRRDASGRDRTGRNAGYQRNPAPGREQPPGRDAGPRRGARAGAGAHGKDRGATAGARADAGEHSPSGTAGMALDDALDETREQPLTGRGRRRARRLPGRPVLLAGGAVGIGLVVLLIAIMFTMGGGSNGPVAVAAPSASSTPDPLDTSGLIHVLGGTDAPTPGDTATETPANPQPTSAAPTRSPARVQLGPVDVNGYCRAHAFARAVLTKPATGTGAAYDNWACESRNGKQRTLLAMNDACPWQYGSPATAVALNPNDANSWRCYR